MSLFVNGDKDVVKKVRNYAKKIGLCPLYHNESMSPSDLSTVYSAGGKIEKKITYAVDLLGKRYSQVKHPLEPTEIPGIEAGQRGREEMSRILKIAYYRGLVDRVEKPGCKQVQKYLYLPKGAEKN